MRIFPGLGLSLFVAISPAAYADDAPETFEGEVSLNGSKSTGNADTTDVGAAVKLKWRAMDWRHRFSASGDYAEQNGEDTRSRYRLAYQIDRDFSERIYAYASTDYFSDDFGPYKFGFFAGGGMGYRAALPPPLQWDVQAGPGYRRQKTREPIDVPPGDPSRIESEIALRAASELSWDINDNVDAYNNTEVVSSSSNTFLTNEVGVTADLFGGLALRTSFRVEHNTDVAVDREKTDTITRLGVVYAIK